MTRLTVVTILQCIQMSNHYVVHLKLIEHSISIIPQLQKNSVRFFGSHNTHNISYDLYWASCQVFQYLSVFLVEILVNLILGSSVSHNWFLKKFTSILIIFVKRKVREFSLIRIFYWAKKFANREASNRNWYEVQKHNVTGWIKKWKRSCLIFTKIGYYKTGYKEGRGLLKRDYLVSF